MNLPTIYSFMVLGVEAFYTPFFILGIHLKDYDLFYEIEYLPKD
jgi:hypothetical protein